MAEEGIGNAVERRAEAAGSLRSWGVDNSSALIDFRNVSVMRGERVVLDRLSLRIETGEHVAILGPNGCGKSTLVKTITRDLYPLRREGMSAQILGRDRWHLLWMILDSNYNN